MNDASLLTAVPPAVPPGAAVPSDASGRRLARSLWANKSAVVGLAVLALMAVIAIFAPLLAPADPGAIDLAHRLAKPIGLGGSWARPLGTDALGHDELSLLVYGARVSLTTGLLVILLAGSVGTALGLVAGYIGGWRETVIMRVVDASIAFPGLLLALTVLVLLGSGQTTLVLVLSAISWMIFTRVTHDMVLGLRESTFVKAAQTVGASRTRIIWRHLLPNLASALLTVATLEFATVVLAEASLSYLGFGIQPPQSSWGLMVANGQQYLSEAWWLVGIPGVAIAATVLALNLVAGWLRIAADPRQREKQVGTLRSARRVLERALAESGVKPHRVVVERADAGAGPLLEVRGLEVDFAVAGGAAHAVRSVDLTVARGETLGLVGESGSGKTVSALALLDLVVQPGRITAGDVTWRLPQREGSTLDARHLVGDRVTMVFQDPFASLNPLVPVGRQISEVLRKKRGLSRSAAQARAVELLDLVGIPDPARQLGRLPYELSGGMAQRVMMAIALAPEPDLIIADEPTTALDVTIQAQILDLLRDLQRRFGMTLILVAHDLGVVAGMCDRVAVMYAGRVVEEGTASEVFAQPRHPYTAGLVASTPRLDRPRRQRMHAIAGTAPAPTTDFAGCAFAPRCERADGTCWQDRPPLAVVEGSQRAACWHPIERAGEGHGA